MSETLATRYAELKGSPLLRYRREDELNVIVLEDGRKDKFTDDELDNAIREMEKKAQSTPAAAAERAAIARPKRASTAKANPAGTSRAKKPEKEKPADE